MNVVTLVTQYLYCRLQKEMISASPYDSHKVHANYWQLAWGIINLLPCIFGWISVTGVGNCRLYPVIKDRVVQSNNLTISVLTWSWFERICITAKNRSNQIVHHCIFTFSEAKSLHKVWNASLKSAWETNKRKRKKLSLNSVHLCRWSHSKLNISIFRTIWVS